MASNCNVFGETNGKITLEHEQGRTYYTNSHTKFLGEMVKNTFINDKAPLKEASLLGDVEFTEYDLVDPLAGEGTGFGNKIVPLSTGNVVVTKPYANVDAATAAGAAFLYNGETRALISMLTGSNDDDNVGIRGVTALTNGNYVVGSYYWNNGAVLKAGAVTLGNGATGISGEVSVSNSLVGSSADDKIGFIVEALTNGNYVAGSREWDNPAGPVSNVGAITWGDGTTGIVGTVSVSNSLVGSAINDYIGNNRVVTLTNGNYVVISTPWKNGAIPAAGAVTWVNGATGEPKGPVTNINSLVGSTNSDNVGSGGVIALTNGNYAVCSSAWDNLDGPITDAGAVTFVNGSTGEPKGPVTSSNSLIGSQNNDQVGFGSAIALTNGNYVVKSSLWNNGGISYAGAATWINGVTGEPKGAVTTTNSLVGTNSGERVGLQVVALTNGNYVVVSTKWKNPGLDTGAVTWGDGTVGITGTIDSTNSLIGSKALDEVGSGGVTALTNGNYVIKSNDWQIAPDAVGAVTWGDGTVGITGEIDSTNSLLGSTDKDLIGGSITALTNGNYIIASPYWDDGATANVGAVTWGDGTVGITGIIDSTNSLIGSTAEYKIGSDNIAALTNGNYAVASFNWDNPSGPVSNVGAATWGDGTVGITGTIDSTNSLVGSTADDKIGSGGITALSNGEYVVLSPLWNNDGIAFAGAFSICDGSGGTVGEVNSSNSILGRQAASGLSSETPPEDTVNNSVYAVFANENAFSGRVTVVYLPSPTPTPTPSGLTFADIVRINNTTLPARNELFVDLHPFNEYINKYLKFFIQEQKDEKEIFINNERLNIENQNEKITSFFIRQRTDKTQSLQE